MTSLSESLRAASIHPEAFDLAALAEDAARLEREAAQYREVAEGATVWTCREHRAQAQPVGHLRCPVCGEPPSDPPGTVRAQDDGRPA